MQPSATHSDAATAYGRLDRLLHRFALGGAAVPELSFDIEQSRFGRAADALTLQPPIFVTGLARAGTTILTQLIHASGGFATLTYRDMPFPLAPNSWARFSGGRKVATRERGHGDGLMHDLDSAEAIEEVFWRVRVGEGYCRPEGLVPVAADAETIEAFRRYVRLVCLARGETRYLSKNNNNVLRLKCLAWGFPDAIMVHPFREPVAQAMSLLRQHRQALELAKADRFRADFMRWLGHYEFGAHQRPFLFPGAPALDADRDALSYWLTAWISVHRHLLAQPEPVRRMQCFVDYDRFSTGDPGYLGALTERLGLVRPLDGSTLRSASPVAAPDAPEALVDQARTVHAALVERAGLLEPEHLA